jgi:hypothetical protein
MADQYIERVENLIRVVGSVRDADFNLGRWCHCAIGHAMNDAYFIALGFDPMRECCDPGIGLMPAIGKFFDVSAARAAELFIPNIDTNYQSRGDVLASLRVLLLEKMAQQIDEDVKPAWSTPHIDELADAAA